MCLKLAFNSCIILFSILLIKIIIVNGLTISFEPNNITIHEDEVMTIEYNITDVNDSGGVFEIYIEDETIASLDDEIILTNPQVDTGGVFNITGKFIGRTNVICRNIEENVTAEGNLSVVVLRKERIIDTIFTVSVAVFVSIVYINFGSAINWSELFFILKRPIGPTIGLCGQFILMPLLSYGIGQLLFPDNPEMQLGIFFTGVAPAGGASNLWAVLLGGNLNLSIIMTTISTIGAFGTMPLWIFTLGKVIFDKGNLEVPYFQITIYVVSLIIPLAIGFYIQKYYKNVAEFMKRILKGLSIFLLVFIIIFASATNSYLFQLFSWKIVIAGMALPWLGYILGYLGANIFRQPYPDCLTIAIEIGIQNTGIPIFLLRFALPQPQADLTTVAPVAVAILTPFPLMFFYIWLKIRDRFLARNKESTVPMLV